jgi:hypothetical protein
VEGFPSTLKEEDGALSNELKDDPVLGGSRRQREEPERKPVQETRCPELFGGMARGALHSDRESYS